MEHESTEGCWRREGGGVNNGVNTHVSIDLPSAEPMSGEGSIVKGVAGRLKLADEARFCRGSTASS